MSLFPLPLTACEEYLARDDYAAYPNTIAERFRFEGRMDWRAAERAEACLLRRHPLIGCRVRWRKRLGRSPVPEWLPAESPEHHLGRFARSEVGDWPVLSGIDLDSGPAGRIAYVFDEDSTDILLQGHHAFCDGVAGLQIMIDFMQAYAQAVEAPDREPQLLALDSSLLRVRGDFGFGSWAYLRRLHRQALGLYGVHEFLNHTAQPLVPAPLSELDQSSTETSPSSLTFRTESESLPGLKLRAKRSGVTVNEWLLAALFQAMLQWRQTRELAAPGDWMRVMVPMNLRDLRHRRMPAANRVSFVSLDRQPGQCRDFTALANSIHQQMSVIHDNDLGLTFLTMLGLARLTPGGMKRLAKPDRCGATAILTNLGDPLRKVRLPRRNGELQVGNLTLKEMDLLPPLRPNTNIALAAFRYAGRQCLTLHHDSRVIQSEDAADLLQRLCGIAFSDDE